MSIASNDPYDYISYINESVFEQYLALVEEAIEEDDLETLERFWNAAATMGARGQIIQILINEGSNRIVERARFDEGELPFYLPVRRGPYNFRLLMQRYNGYRLEEAIKRGDQERIKELLALDEDVIRYYQKDIVELAVEYKNFPLLETLLQMDSANARLIYSLFNSKYETYYHYRPGKPLTEAELISFLVVLMHALPLIPRHEEWVSEFVILLYRAAVGAIVTDVDGKILLEKYVAQLTSTDKSWLLSLLEDGENAEEMNEYAATLLDLLKA